MKLNKKHQFLHIFITSFVFLVLSGLVLLPAGADPVIDPENVKDNLNFSLQGEFRGSINNTSAGVQIVQASKSQFNGFLFQGGLPGENVKSAQSLGKGKKQGNRLLFETDTLDLIATPKMVKVTGGNGNQIGELKRVHRRSDTLGKKPPEDAVVLYDGTASSLKNWAGGERSENGFLTEGTKTKQKFHDFTLHMEFRLPYKPSENLSSQSRGNSGVYIFNNYEIQLLETYGLPYMNFFSKQWQKTFKQHFGYSPGSGPSRWCGSFYKFQTARLNMNLPPLSWQTYDIQFTAPHFENGKKVKNARVTVWQNGVKIHDDLKLGKGTGAGKGREEVENGRIHFQDHGNPVRFRNIWIVEE